MFTQREKKRMSQALRLAIDYQESLIDAHRTNLRHTPRGVESCFPKDFLPYVTRWRRDIAVFCRLLDKLK